MKHVTSSARAALFLLGSLALALTTTAQTPAAELQKVTLKISLGHTAGQRVARTVRLIGASPGLVFSKVAGKGTEENDLVAPDSLLNCGMGDVDELVTDVSWPTPSAPLRKMAYHKDGYALNGDAMWGYLMKNGSPGQAARLRDDSWQQPDAPVLTVQLNKEGTEGFSIALEQLLRHGSMWLPEHDVYVAVAGKGLSFQQHLAGLKGQRILDSVEKAPDASLFQFKKLWADIGNPLAWNVSWQTKYMGTEGHLTVTAPAHGAIHKFAVDRWGNVRPDFASPHKFRLDVLWPGSQWKGQKITNGLPVIVTALERNQQHCAIEQFASSLDTTAARQGELPGVMFTKVKISGKTGPVDIGFRLNNESKDRAMELKQTEGKWMVTDKETGDLLLMLEPGRGLTIEMKKAEPNDKGRQVMIRILGRLVKGETKEILLKLPSPAVAEPQASQLCELDFNAAKEKTVTYWEEWISRGARFRVPEEAVNQLFRANLWHALILPRHTLDTNGNPHMDLPYANTAYGQKDADWPINQAVYVDYMIYGLRGYDAVAEDEIAAMFRSQQEPDGRIGGFANWGVYSPGHLYAIAQNYLLSRNREQFERLLPQSMKTLDWCIAQIHKANDRPGKTGLILAPLNDLTNAEREWAFTQAYFAGGLKIFGEALSAYDHPRAGEVLQAAAQMKQDIVQEFSRSSVRSPVVQLADGTWSNYVPTDAMTTRRMMDQWYPTDVDCGPLHLSRLGVLDPFSWLTTAMLNDHEDNLFFKNQGAANEPVYVQQGNTYLLRDDPKAVIRAFYSLMACGFSHEQFTSLEHRWAWGQYYGPPSTDGAWFELYRKMLINEFGYDTLMIGQAIPRDWLSGGKKIEVKDAPTYFGPVSFMIEGQNASNEIRASITLSERNPPKALLLRFRHPAARPIRSVTVNGQAWTNFDVKKEQVMIPMPKEKTFTVAVRY